MSRDVRMQFYPRGGSPGILPADRLCGRDSIDWA